MRPHKYVIKLSVEERRTLQSLNRSGKTESRLTERAKTILWADEGLTIDTSAYRLGCPSRNHSLLATTLPGTPHGGDTSLLAGLTLFGSSGFFFPLSR